MSLSDAKRLSPGDIVDDFEIGEVLAEGGSSITFRATARTLERQVEFKYFLPDGFTGDAGAIDAARSSASAVARLEHPGITPVFAAGEHRGGLYIASALPSGASIGDAERSKTITPVDTAKLVTELAVALEHAHARGVLHRDLRPDCVTVGRWGHGVLRDFGVTRLSGRTGLLTRAEVMESLRYTAPEIVLGKTPTPAADTYGLAAIAVWCLTGAPPYRDRPAGEYVMFRTSAPAPSLEFARGGAAPELTAALASAMAVDPAARPTPVEFAKQLAAAIDGLSPAVRDTPTPFVAIESLELVEAPVRRAPEPRSRVSDATRVENRRPLPAQASAAATKTPLSTYGACAAIAFGFGVIALAVGRFTAPGPPKKVPLGPFSVQPAAVWKVTDRSSTVSLAGLPGQIAELGVANGGLPGDPLTSAQTGHPGLRAKPVTSGKVPLAVYAGSGTLIVVRSTTAGALYARCSPSTTEARCAALVVNAEAKGKPVPATPDAGVADALRSGMNSVEQALGTGLTQLSADPKQRAAGAATLATSLREAAGSLKVDGADPGTAAKIKAISATIAQEAAAFEDLGSAIDRKSSTLADAARARAVAADGRMRAALAKFTRAGYQVKN